jgi:hypothetical protein
MRKVISAPLVPLHFLWVCYGSFHSVQILCFGFAPVVLPALRILRPLRVWFISTTMPWERGKPKRGPSWYNYAARQRRIRRLAQASSTSLICRDGGHDEPPMAIVEEEIPAEPIIVPSTSLLYIVPDPHDPPSTSHYVPAAACTSDWATCIIQEEISSVDRPMETPPPSSTRTGTRTPLVSSRQNIWNSSLRCAGICRINYTGIPCSTTVSTFCMMRSRVRRANNGA